MADTGDAPSLAFSSAPTCLNAEPGQQGAAPAPEEVADHRDTADAALVLAAPDPAAAASTAASAAPERLAEEETGSSAAEEAAGSLNRTGAGADLQDPGPTAARDRSATGCGEADTACPDVQAAQPSVELTGGGEAVASAAAASERAPGPSQALIIYAAATRLPEGGEQGSAAASAPAECDGVSISTAASVSVGGASAAVRVSAGGEPDPAALGGAWSSSGAAVPAAAPDQQPAGAAEEPEAAVNAQHDGAEAAAQPPAPRAPSPGQHRVTFAGLPGEPRGGGAAGEPAAGVHELLERADEERAALVAENGALQQRIRQVRPRLTEWSAPAASTCCGCSSVEAPEQMQSASSVHGAPRDAGVRERALQRSMQQAPWAPACQSQGIGSAAASACTVMAGPSNCYSAPAGRCQQHPSCPGLQILDARKRGPPTPPVERARAANSEARFASALAAWQRTRQARDGADADAETRRVELEARMPRLHLRPATYLCAPGCLGGPGVAPPYPCTGGSMGAPETGDLEMLCGCNMTFSA